MRTSSSSSRAAPASKREISSRSETSCVKRAMGALGHLVAPRLEDLDRRGERRQRRPQLVADVGREPRVALDALLERAGHLVEGVDQRRQVGIVGTGDARVEPAAGDGLGGDAEVAERAQHLSAARRAEHRAGERGDRRRRQQRDPERVQRALHLLERDDLVVLRVHGRQRHADGQLRLVVEPEAHAGRLTVGDLLAQRARDVVEGAIGAGREPLTVDHEHGVGARRGLEAVEQLRGLQAGGAQLLADELRVEEHLALRARLALAHDVLAREPERDRREERGEDEPAERERDREAGAQAEPQDPPRALGATGHQGWSL
jgi:hypothetical protein